MCVSSSTETNYWKDRFSNLFAASAYLKIDWLYIYMFILRLFILLHWSFCPSFYYYSTVLIAVVFLVVLDILYVSSPTLIFSKLVFLFFGPWHFHINARIVNFHENQNIINNSIILKSHWISTSIEGKVTALGVQIYEFSIFPG